MSISIPDNQTIEQFLRRHFIKPKPSRFWRMLGVSSEWNYKILHTEVVELGRIFQGSIVIRVVVYDRFLQHKCLPGPGSYGVFSYDSEHLRYLSQSEQNNFEELFQREGLILNNVDPRLLSRLFCEVLLDHETYSHDVIVAAEELENYGSEPFVPYVLDMKEWRQVKGHIEPPGVVRHPLGGWLLNFTSVYGWMHLKNRLGIHRFRISEDYSIEYLGEQILSEKIFAETPLGKY